jgi:hypothetical protein
MAAAAADRQYDASPMSLHIASFIAAEEINNKWKKNLNLVKASWLLI